MLSHLPSVSRLFVKQAFEIGEIFGFETRNKYRICDADGRDVAFAAEQQKGWWGFLFRQGLGHWRTFQIHFYDLDRKPFLVAEHPFRWFFQRLEIRDSRGRYLGAIVRRFSILSKSFEILDSQGRVTLEVSSPFWKIWTFPFRRGEVETARVSKKWSGLGFEMLTDRDNFLVEYLDDRSSSDERALVLAAAIFVDLMFFERKGGSGLMKVFGD